MSARGAWVVLLTAVLATSGSCARQDKSEPTMSVRQPGAAGSGVTAGEGGGDEPSDDEWEESTEEEPTADKPATQVELTVAANETPPPAPPEAPRAAGQPEAWQLGIDAKKRPPPAELRGLSSVDPAPATPEPESNNGPMNGEKSLSMDLEDGIQGAFDAGWRDAKPAKESAKDEAERQQPIGANADDLAGAEQPDDDSGDRDQLDARTGGRYRRDAMTLRQTGEDAETFVAPATTLPRMFYFENTYLGGSAAYAERLLRLDRALAGEARPYEIVRAEVQPFDPPRTDGLGVVASIDATHFERARRVFLQVGLRGSSRYGWRRPPLDIVLVIDQPAFGRGPAFVTGFVVDLLRRLGPSDRLGIVLAGAEAPIFLELARLGPAQQHLANRIDELRAPLVAGADDLARAMRRAGGMLEDASDDEATVPGTKTLFVLSGEHDQARIGEAARAAHELTVEGCVSSVFALDAERSEWWQVADAGYGNLHRITADRFADAIDEEMQSLARVVARLVRVNVRLGKEAAAIRVLGTRVLERREVEEVKARELATDRNLSKSLGITSDRGEDDDGIQTVIPYFYGDDSHVILIELWVEGPGLVADVTVRYKDMVNLDNATARTSVLLGSRPQEPTAEQVLIAKNVRGFQLAENLQRASDAVERNDMGGALQNLGAAAGAAEETNTRDSHAVEGLRQMVERGDWQSNPARRAMLRETLLISGQRRVGDTDSDGE